MLIKRNIIAFVMIVVSSLSSAKQDLLADKVFEYIHQLYHNYPGKLSIEILSNEQPPCNSYYISESKQKKTDAYRKIGFRCNEGSGDYFYVSVKISLTGKYFTYAEKLNSGYVLGELDLIEKEGDITSSIYSAEFEKSSIVGRQLRMPVFEGAVVRKAQLRSVVTVKASSQVPIYYLGSDFTASTTATALYDAGEGEKTMVRLKNGRVLSGTVTSGGKILVR